MQVILHKPKTSLVMRAAFLVLCAALFAIPAKAQTSETLKMTNGTRQVPANGYLFYDSGGPLLFDPAVDPENANEYNWTTWYQHNEDYTLTLTVPEGYGIQVAFSKCLINNDFLSFYEGNTVDEEKLIGTFTCNDYSNSLGNFTVVSHGNMTIHFVSDYHWRDEGWEAVITRVTTSTFAPQPPVAVMAACDNQMSLIPTTLGNESTVLQYKIGSGSYTTYTPGALIDLNSQTFPLTVSVKAIVDNVASTEKNFTFANKIEPPAMPTYTSDPSTNTITVFFPNKPAGVNDTYYIRWTINNNPNTTTEDPHLWEVSGHEFQQPSNTPNTVPAGVIDYTNVSLATPFYIHFATRGTTCPDDFSSVRTVEITARYAPMPTISFETNISTNEGLTTLECSLDGASIYYTTDGSTPTTTSTLYNGSNFTVQPGTTVKAIAVKTGYSNSAVASDIFVPGGGGQNIANGTVVLLDDREDHSWSYYSDGDQPIHSLNPADVKITYFGNGTGTINTTNSATPASNSWTQNATGVQISNTETENQFIYLKTLERADGSTSNNPTGRCGYTTIANPFSKRPTYQYASGDLNRYCGFYGWRIKAIRGGKVYNANGTLCAEYTSGNVNTNNYLYAESQCYFEPDAETGMEVELEALWARAYVTTSTSTSGLSSSVDYERNFMVLNTNPSGTTSTETIGSGNNNSSYLPTYTYNRYSLSYQLYLASEINGAGQITAIAFRQYRYSTTRNVDIYLKHTSSNTIQTVTQNNNTYAEDMEDAVLVYSGNVTFNGWTTITLQTPFDYDGTSNLIVCVDDNNYNYTTNACQFYTYSTNNNNRAYYWTNDQTNYAYPFGYNNYSTSSYNNQIRFTKVSPAGHNVSTVTVPCTVMGCNPDGSNQSSGAIAGDINCGADLKLEHINVNGSSSSTMNGNGHSLIIGRGVTNGNNNVAGSVYGYQSPSGNIDGFTLRVESGRYTNAYLFYNSSTSQISSSNTWKMILGSDYDRAKKDNSKLTIAGPVEVSYRVSSSSADAKINVVGLSGTFGANDDNNELYMGYENRADDNTAATPRFLEVLGGEYLGGISGGIENGVTATTHVLTMRIKGGTVHQYVYGAGQYSAAIGTRKTIITGGTFDAWVAGGCYGTDANGNAGNTNGDSYVYFGGDANMTNTEGVFGGGYGRGTAGDNKYTINKSFVVVADEAQIAGNVYGGGNKGYNTSDAEVWVLGGGKNTITVSGSVFGGANQARSEATTNVTMKNGTVTGSLYGGANDSGEVAGLATVSFSGGKVSNVFGGGYGTGTNMAAGTVVNVSGGTINNNVYGGGEEGKTKIATHVNISGGTMKNVYGAGKGDAEASLPVTADINGQTFVNVSGGTMDNVYGGGEAGNVLDYIPAVPAQTLTYGFEDGTSQGWTAFDNDGDGASWSVRNVNDHTSYQVHGGSYLLCSSYNANALANNWLVSPQIELGGSISFWVSRHASYTDYYSVYVSTDGNNYTRLTGPTVAPTSYTQVTVSLSGYTGQGFVAIVHTAQAVDQGYIFIDDVVITTPAVEQVDFPLASTVTIQGGTINQDVFGGGRLGHTTGNVLVNVYDGNIAGNVYGGAFGLKDEVFIAGTHTVNVTGGNIYTNVYGGSRNADDALTFDPTGGGTDPINHVNISGGHIYYQVFGGGYFGHTYGSVYVFVGQNAINNAPNAAPTTGVSYNAAALLIDGSVWAGADFGNFNGEEFGAATIEGYSNVYIDGLGYNTVSTQPSDAGYMNIGGSVFGSGTSCYGGIQGRDLILRNYGQAVENANYGSKEAIVEPYTTATRNLKSIQFFNNAIIDQAHIHFIGQGRINSLVATEKYSVYEIATVARITNGSSLFLDFPMDQIMKLGSYVCSDVYEASPSFTVVNYTDLPTAGHDNKFRVNNGSFINVKYIGGYGTGKDYGELEGFFYMMTEDENSTCAYARPKQSTDAGNQINSAYDNPNDGGFLSYDATYNTYNIQGGTANPGVQMPYENHTLTAKNGEQYFRIWRYGGIFSYREGVFNAVAKTDIGYSTVDVVISLPASRGNGSYFRIKTVDGFPLVDYGTDVMTVNAGVYNSTDGTPANNGWMYYDNTTNTYVFPNDTLQTNVADALEQMHHNVNANFGLVAIPYGSLEGGDNSNWLICNAASDEGEILTSTTWQNMDNTINPSILFRLTYNNHLTNNVTWDPIIITFEQCDANGNVTDEIQVALSVNTSTTIEQVFTAQTYALMNGQGTVAETYVAKVVLPSYIPYVNVEGDLSRWTFKSAQWIPVESEPGVPNAEFTNAWQQGSGYIHDPAANNEFSMQIQPSYNYDNTLGWTSYDHTAHDLKTMSTGTYLSSTDGRSPAALDFILHFDGKATCTSTELMGTLKVTLHFTNYGASTEPDHGKDLIINVEVWRRGQGMFYYLDGVNGDNFFSGTYPNAPKKTLSGIFNHSNYLPGDVIFIVNTVTAKSANALDWNGEQYGQVVLYRYPGGHPLNLSGEDPVYEGYDVENNLGFGGTLVKVERSMNMHGIVLDGFYYVKDTTNFAAHGGNLYYPIEEKYVTPTSPLVEIDQNASLTLYAESRLQWNYANCDGAAVYNEGELILRGGSSIEHNAVLANTYHGGGVYLADGATLLVSDLVTIDTNHIVTHEHVAVHGTDKNNNVYLAAANSVVQVGTADPTDGLSALEADSRIGVTKGNWGNYYYTPIAYSDGGMNYLGNIIPENTETAQARDYLIFDDDLYYPLVTLNNTPGYEPSSDYLFWVGTWVTTVREQPADFDADDIDTPEELAWAISIVNGLNTVTTPLNSTNFNITGDIDMNARIWVPMGTSIAPYLGHFNANGHLIEGVRSPLNSENMGMFGYVGNNANIENMVLNVEFNGGNSVNMAAVAANMTGGTISNVEVAGTIVGTDYTNVMGGIVANKTGGKVHSSFAVNTLTTTNADSDMGGLVGINTGDLFNSYSNVVMTGSDRIGGLAGVNRGTIENCYVVLGDQTFPAFAYDNSDANGHISVCYAAEGISNYVTSGLVGDLTDHGNYGAVETNIKSLNYMYYDNLIDPTTNTYVSETGDAGIVKYDANHAPVWNGLLSALNQWVKGHSGYTKWNRPITSYINGDLPVLAFPADSCLATLNSDGRYLRYSPNLDVLLSGYNDNGTGTAEPDATLFVYGTVSDVALVPKSNVNVFVNEDAVLLQAAGAEPFGNVTVGVTFDNSCRNASDYWGNPLEYDWHMMSTPLSDAAIGITYDDEHLNYGLGSGVNVASISGSYFPNGLPTQLHQTLKWDIYTYFEREYHWVNLKRNHASHYYYDTEEPLTYDVTPDDNCDGAVFVPGKGYMMAISRDSYMNSRGTLNPYDVSITITNQEQLGEDYNSGWNLVGNPFQAYLDINVLNRPIYAYDADQGVYAPYTTDASQNPAIPSRYIHPHQAFFVHAGSDTENLVFTQAMATTKSTPTSFFRGDQVNYPLVNLFAENEQGNRDLTVIEFNRPELGGVTKMDYLTNSNFKIAAHLEGRSYGLVFTPEGTERVPVRFMADRDGTYTLRWSTYNGDFTSLRLVDNKTGVNYDMLANDHYTFEASVDDYASRFYITFSVTGVDEQFDDNDSFAYFDGSEWVIEGKGMLDVVDVLGRTLYRERLTNDSNRVSLNGVASGVYLLRVSDGTRAKVQKIVVR